MAARDHRVTVGKFIAMDHYPDVIKNESSTPNFVGDGETEMPSISCLERFSESIADTCIFQLLSTHELQFLISVGSHVLKNAILGTRRDSR